MMKWKIPLEVLGNNSTYMGERKNLGKVEPKAQLLTAICRNTGRVEAKTV